MDKLTKQAVYLITEPTQYFQRTDEFTIQDKTGNVINYLEKRSDLYVLTEEELEKIIGVTFEAGRSFEYGNQFGPIPNPETNKTEYINSLLK